MPIMKISLDDGPVDYTAARRFALIAAFMKIICTILLVVLVSIRTTARGIDLGCSPVDCDAPNAIQQLDTCCLRQFWQERSRFAWLSFGFDFAEFVSAFLFITPMLALADVWGRRITTNKLMVSAFVTSAGISLLEFLFRSGLVSGTNWLAGWSSMTAPSQTNIPAVQMLTVSYLVTNSQGAWAFAADDLFLGVGLFSASYLTIKYGQLPRGHAYLGFFVGGLSMLSFILELARFGEWERLAIAASVIYGLVGFVFLPAWLIYLACFLGHYASADLRANLTDEVGLPPAGTASSAAPYSDSAYSPATAGATAAGGLASHADRDDGTL